MVSAGDTARLGSRLFLPEDEVARGGGTPG